ncbi:MAG TPA: amidohydrolase family protein [Williamwhitmania sp.]|nr:amidohydrolase family protein [Williamwhitmania sp.]
MRKISASLVFPISTPPIRHGVVVVDSEGTILELQGTLESEAEDVEYYNGIILPGLVNAYGGQYNSYIEDESKTVRKSINQKHFHSGTVLVGIEKYGNDCIREYLTSSHVTYRVMGCLLPETSLPVNHNVSSTELPFLVKFGNERASWEATLNKLLQLPTNLHLLVHHTVEIPEKIIASIVYRFLFCSFIVSDTTSAESISRMKKLGCKIVLGSVQSGSTNMLQLLKSIQETNDNIALEEMLTWATLNGALALGVDDTFGCLEKNKKPGVLLLTGINMQTFKINEGAKLRRLV